MKKTVVIAAVIFVLTAIAAYFICSFCIPGWRIKLEADSVTIFWETLKIMMPLKIMISVAVGAISGCIPFLFRKNHSKRM